MPLWDDISYLFLFFNYNNDDTEANHDHCHHNKPDYPGGVFLVLFGHGFRVVRGFGRRGARFLQGSLKEEPAKKAGQVAGKDNEDIKSREKNAESPEGKLDMTAETVLQRKEMKLETRSLISKILNVPFRALIKPIFLFRYLKLSGKWSINFWHVFPYCDNGFETNDSCTGCGICAKLCPVGNIKIAGGKPEWLNRCENCFACYVWCPQKAICGEMVKYNPNTHHPEITLADML